MAQTRGSTHLHASTTPFARPESAADARVFQRGLEAGRNAADLTLRRISAWAEENPGQMMVAALALGFVMGKLFFRRPRRVIEELE